jgi:hypothetical protein
MTSTLVSKNMWPAMFLASMLATACAPTQGYLAPSLVQNARTTARAAAKSATPYLYVMDPGARHVAIYSTITGLVTKLIPVSNPKGLAVDHFGTVYIADAAKGDVFVYKSTGPGMVRRVRKITAASVLAIAVDGSANLFVLQGSNGVEEIAEYPAGKNVPSRLINKGLYEVTAIATDTQGNVYAANFPSSVFVYKPGALSPNRTITNGIADPVALAVDSSGNLFVANNDGAAATVTEYAPGRTSPKTIRRGVSQPQTIAVNASGDLYLADYVSNGVAKAKIIVYAPGARSPMLTIPGSGCINSSGCHTLSLAFDPAGNLYVPHIETNKDGGDLRGSVSVFKPGQTTELKRITASMDTPSQIAVVPGN